MNKFRTLEKDDIANVKYIMLGDSSPVYCKSQKECFTNFLREIERLYPGKLHSLIGKVHLLTSNPLDFLSIKVITKGVYVGTNLDRPRCESTIKAVLRKLNLDLSFFKFSGDSYFQEKTVVNQNTGSKVFLQESCLWDLNNSVTKAILLLENYKIADAKCYSAVLNKDITFKDNISAYYGEGKRMTDIEFAALLFPEDKIFRQNGNQIRNHALVLIISEIYDEILKFTEIVNNELKNSTKIYLKNPSSVNLRLIKDLTELFPDCDFEIDIKNNCINKKF